MSVEAPPATGGWTRFCPVTELPPESKKAVRLGNAWVLVCHTEDRYYAVSNVCSHATRPLTMGRVRHCTITCPVHGAKFNLETGAALNLPATKPIATYPVRVAGDWIEVRV
jgi:3-phenylpropionate/trans-cinnamate dioxygenase ferredoxin component